MTATSATQHCPQCWTERPLEEFISRDGSRFVQWCMPCRDRYKGAGAAWASLSPAERRARMRARPKRRTGDGHHVTFTLRSGNKKTGRIPVSMTDMQSCPTSCSFRDAGCYAEFHNLRAHWARVPERGMSWADFCAAVARLPIGQLWRHNEAGDLPGVGDELDVDAFRELVRANARAGARGFTFTHKPLRRRVERKAVADGNRVGLTVNLSADSLKQADELAAKGIGPVVVVVPSDAPRTMSTPRGRAVVTCVAQQSEGMTCEQCELCAKPDRQSIVAFRAHGQAHAIVSDLVRLRRRAARKGASS